MLTTYILFGIGSSILISVLLYYYFKGCDKFNNFREMIMINDAYLTLLILSGNYTLTSLSCIVLVHIFGFNESTTYDTIIGYSILSSLLFIELLRIWVNRQGSFKEYIFNDRYSMLLFINFFIYTIFTIVFITLNITL